VSEYKHCCGNQSTALRLVLAIGCSPFVRRYACGLFIFYRVCGRLAVETANYDAHPLNCSYSKIGETVMPILYNTLNRDYSQIEGQDSDGIALEMNLDEQKLHDAKPRLKRERRRFRLTRPFEYERKIFDYPLTDILVWDVDSYQYYEDCETTIDTVRNPSHVPSSEEARREESKDDGGEFTHCKITFDDWVTEYVEHIYQLLEVGWVRGHVWLTPPSFFHDGIDVSTSIMCPTMDTDLSSSGPAMWKLMSPLRPGVDLGVDLAEIREVPRMLQHAVTTLDSIKSVLAVLSNPKKIAQWVLAINFGWKPLVADIKKAVKTFEKLDRRIDFILRNGGIPLRRRTPPFAPEVTEEVLFSYSGPDDQGWMRDIPFPSGWEDPPGQPGDGQTRFECKLVCRKTVTNVASGEFIYYLGDLPPTKAYLRLKLLGLIADESLMWEATRWSWLIDWFSNIGDVIANIQSNLRDRLVSTYAYNQRHTVREYTWTATNGYYSVKTVRIFDTKRREKIDPFGLAAGVSLTDLQLGILLALGLTRA
jgi:hypothetical protein